ncbi:RNA polymerase sigma-70 factor (family 1) [Pedobacter africanus]|uniref:RNA polymerase sigma-70 factor (ECF subfamily) n=1 Tax=Pedobacter africanus TaxID=151894 RepID=A0ACC6KQX4_9SPHI|nr:RNA polymerase sigma-70 factor [Pedobacter africanus]MDR6781601.1 RNA polymerase sigma-70 factor (ECF subfamily) [Pedobacter africanus]
MPVKTTAAPLCTDLLTSLKKGEARAMEQIYKDHWADVFDSACRRVRDEDVAQDTTQEIFISLWENRQRLAISGSLRSYLLAAVKYKVINYFKSAIVKDKYQEDLFFLAEGQVELSAENKLMLKDLSKEIDEALQDLPEKMRQIFRMSRMQEKTIREISTELGLSGQTVKNQISAALKMLKERLSYLPFLILILLFT